MNRKNLTAAVLAAFVAIATLTCFATPVMAMDPCMAGHYSDAKTTEYEGIDLEVIDTDLVVVDFYTWEFFDGDAQNWVVFAGDPADMDAFDVYSFDGQRDEYRVGSGKVVAVDDDTVEFSHDFLLNLDLIGEPGLVIPYCFDKGQCERTYTYTRFTQPIPCAG